MPRARATSSSRASSASDGPLRLRLTICASASTAKCSARARLSVSQTVTIGATSRCQQARRPSSRARGATPAMPMPLSAMAAMIPATAVPCSSGRSARSVTKLRASTTCPARSGCIVSIRLSTTATRTPRPCTTLWSVFRCQASAVGCAGSSGSARAADASTGRPWAWNRLTGWAPATPGSLLSAADTVASDWPSGTDMMKQSTPSNGIGQSSTSANP